MTKAFNQLSGQQVALPSSIDVRGRLSKMPLVKNLFTSGPTAAQMAQLALLLCTVSNTPVVNGDSPVLAKRHRNPLDGATHGSPVRIAAVYRHDAPLLLPQKVDVLGQHVSNYRGLGVQKFSFRLMPSGERLSKDDRDESPPEGSPAEEKSNAIVDLRSGRYRHPHIHGQIILPV